jgi:glucose dehydrogenase
MTSWRTAILVRDADAVLALDREFVGAPDRYGEALIACAQTDSDERVRAFCTRVLGKFKSADRAVLFERLLTDKSPYVRQNAAWALGELAETTNGHIVTRHALAELRHVQAKDPAGDVRAWDAHTGKLVWTFHSIPRPGEKYHETWAGEGWKNRSGVNVWGFITVDVERGIVYMPFGAPSVDQYGGDREGDNLFSTSIVAADANTGKYLWHFQVVHHDLWDGDLSGAPALIDVKQGGRTIPAVAVINKPGLLFLLDRVSGTPIYGVEERPVAASARIRCRDDAR